MTCLICGTEYAHLSWGSPGYSCDCGKEISPAEWRAMDVGRLAELKAEWREQSQKLDEDSRRAQERLR